MALDLAPPRLSPHSMRPAILRVTEHLDGERDPHHVYIVPRHVKALRPESALVVGMRGSGKTVWAAALQSAELRKHLVALVPSWPSMLHVSAGFQADTVQLGHPDRDTIAAILKAGYPARALWRAVISSQTWLKDQRPDLVAAPWMERARWVQEHPEEVAAGLAEYDRRLTTSGQGHLIVFDALDRTGGNDWDRMRSLLRDLLQIVLDLRSFRALRLKVFVRPDMVDDPQVTAFPDASKVVGDRLELDWRLVDLYGLLWQRLAHAPGEAGDSFRHAAELLGGGNWLRVDHTWIVPERLAGEESVQRGVFELLADTWMGKDRRRGRPYLWLPRHLGDSAGRSSPRSFLEAIRVAAERTLAGEEFALSAAGIREGVQAASRRRVEEIGEDHPWAPAAMEPLRNLLVPCCFDEIEHLWAEHNVLARVQTAALDKLPPPHISDGAAGLADDLIGLGVLQRLDGGRINVPDVFRVAFGLRRKGGVPPLRR